MIKCNGLLNKTVQAFIKALTKVNNLSKQILPESCTNTDIDKYKLLYIYAVPGQSH